MSADLEEQVALCWDESSVNLFESGQVKMILAPGGAGYIPFHFSYFTVAFSIIGYSLMHEEATEERNAWNE